MKKLTLIVLCSSMDFEVHNFIAYTQIVSLEAPGKRFPN